MPTKSKKIASDSYLPIMMNYIFFFRIKLVLTAPNNGLPRIKNLISPWLVEIDGWGQWRQMVFEGITHLVASFNTKIFIYLFIYLSVFDYSEALYYTNMHIKNMRCLASTHLCCVFEIFNKKSESFLPSLSAYFFHATRLCKCVQNLNTSHKHSVNKMHPLQIRIRIVPCPNC